MQLRETLSPETRASQDPMCVRERERASTNAGCFSALACVSLHVMPCYCVKSCKEGRTAEGKEGCDDVRVETVKM